MAKARLRKILCIVGSMFMAFAMLSSVQAQNPRDRSEMWQLATDSCLKARNAQTCNCFAGELADRLNEKDWRIFIAEQSKSSAPPSGISEADLDGYGRKIAAAGNACGM